MIRRVPNAARAIEIIATDPSANECEIPLLGVIAAGHPIEAVLSNDLDNLKTDSALKVPLSELAESKEKVRSALNRATRKAGRKVATASDATFLYVWTVTE